MNPFLKKISNSLLYSVKGINFAFKSELSFRLEIFIFLPSLFFILNSTCTANKKMLVLILTFLIFALELINTAIEKTLDAIHPGQAPWVGHIKDMASAAVFMVMCAWGIVLCFF